jgi:hypothetical protein
MALLKFGPYTVQTNSQQAQPSAPSGSSGGNIYSTLANILGRQGIKAGWREYGQPLWNEYIKPLYSDTATGAGGGAVEGSGAIEGAGAGAEGAATEGATSMGAGSWATVAAPLVMAYLRYQAGSGRNEPVEKAFDTRRTGKMLTDILTGKNIDWSNSESQYGIKPKELSREISGLDSENPNQMLDPGGWTPKDLYDRMLQESSQYYQTGGVGNSGYSGNQINDMFGPLKGKLAQAMGLPSLPDWSNFDKGSGWNPNYLSSDPTGQAIKAQQGFNPFDEQWNALDEQSKNLYTHSNNPDMFGEDAGRRIWENEQIVKNLNDKYKMSLPTAAERLAARNAW